MKNIRRIFKADLRGLFRNFFALVIAVGLCLLPAFYAWFNIYANWDPYANTGNIRIAVSNLDDGCADLDGNQANMGDEIVEQLKQKDNIGWVFTESKKDAVERVKSGDCYAAVVIGKDFSYSMYHALADNIENPKITYYENEKKNAVATKITDTAVSTLQSTINQSFVKVVTEKIFTETNNLQGELSKEDAVDAFVQKLTTVQGYLNDYDKMITSFMKGNDLLTEASGETNENLEASQDMIASGQASMERGKRSLTTTEGTFATFSVKVEKTLGEISNSINSISDDITNAKLEEQIDTLTKDVATIQTDATDLSAKLEDLENYLKKVQGNSDSLSNTIAAVQKMQSLADSVAESGDVEQDATDTKRAIALMQQTLKNYSETIMNISSMFTRQITPQVEELLSNMESVLDSTEKILDNLSGTLDGMKDIFDGVDTTLGTVNVSLTQLQDVLTQANTKITDALDQIREASDSEQLSIKIGRAHV